MEEKHPAQQGHLGHDRQVGTTTEEKPSEAAIALSRYIEDDANELVRILRSYVLRAGLASHGEDVQMAALNLLNEVYLEASKTAQHYDLSRPPRAWLLGIASNIVKREKARRAKSVEVSLSTLQQEQQEDSNLLMLAPGLIDEGFEQQVEVTEQTEFLLSLVSESDQEVLRLSIFEGLDGQELAQHLQCSYKAALVRLCRAKKRLRIALEKQRGERNE